MLRTNLAVNLSRASIPFFHAFIHHGFTHSSSTTHGSDDVCFHVLFLCGYAQSTLAQAHLAGLADIRDKTWPIVRPFLLQNRHQDLNDRCVTRDDQGRQVTVERSRGLRQLHSRHHSFGVARQNYYRKLGIHLISHHHGGKGCGMINRKNSGLAKPIQENSKQASA